MVNNHECRYIRKNITVTYALGSAHEENGIGISYLFNVVQYECRI